MNIVRLMTALIKLKYMHWGVCQICFLLTFSFINSKRSCHELIFTSEAKSFNGPNWSLHDLELESLDTYMNYYLVDDLKNLIRPKNPYSSSKRSLEMIDAFKGLDEVKAQDVVKDPATFIENNFDSN